MPKGSRRMPGWRRVEEESVGARALWLERRTAQEARALVGKERVGALVR